MDEKSHMIPPLTGSDIGGTLPSRDPYQSRSGFAELPLEKPAYVRGGDDRLRLHGQGPLERVAERGQLLRRPRLRQKVLVGPGRRPVAEAAAEYGWAESATDWRAVIERDDIDIVDICAPGWMHAEIAIAALEAGKHVLVEKPLANTLAEAEAMTAAAARPRAARACSPWSASTTAGSLPWPWPASSSPRAGSAPSGTSAQPTCRTGSPTRQSPMTWRLRKETAGSGALGDIASHAIDQILYLLGRTGHRGLRAAAHLRRRTARARTGLEDVTVDDAAWATLSLASGAIASVEVSRVATGQKNSSRSRSTATRAPCLRPGNPQRARTSWTPPSPLREQGFRRILVNEPEHPYLAAWWPQGHIIGWDHTFTHADPRLPRRRLTPAPRRRRRSRTD